MQPNIQLATLNDLEILVAFSRQLNKDDPAATGEVHFDEPAVRQALQRFLADSTWGQVWLIIDANEPVGYIMVTLGYSLEYHGQDAFIDEFFIKASHRGRGIGRKVMGFVENVARDLGVNALHLEVERNNKVAYALYRSEGFKEHTRYLMTKWIK